MDTPREPLTGKDAVEAVRLCMKLGNENVRFEGPGLMQALRTRAGRLRIMTGLALRIRVPRFTVRASSGKPSRRVARRPQRLGAATAAPGRPTTAPERGQRENGSYGLGCW